MKKTTFEYITEAKNAHVWNFCLCNYAKANTHESYYKIYSLILELEPERPDGDRQKLLANRLFFNLLQKEHLEPDEETIKRVIREMESPNFY